MPAVDAFTGQKILVKVGDGGAPETFAAPALINASRSVSFAAQSNRTVLPDAADPDAPGFEHGNKSGVGSTVTGAGVVHKADMALFDGWVLSPDPKNAMVEVGGSGGRSYAMAMHCTSLEWTGERGDFATCNITLESHGEITPAAIA